MQAPEEAVSLTASYVRICGGGIFFIVAYNLLSASFRGLGDSRSPLLFVLVACLVNIAGDLILVAGYFNGNNQTLWVMIQDLVQTLLVRLPLAYLMSIEPNASLTKIGRAAPASTLAGIVLNAAYYLYWTRREKRLPGGAAQA